MAIATQGTARNYLQRAPSPSGLADVVELILDKGLVIDAYVRISVIGIELITIDARIVIASVDTYLRFAEAVNRLDLTESGGADITDLRGGGGSVGGKAKGALEGAKDKAEDVKEKAAGVKEKVSGKD
jgi:gas vesicle structural protein